MDYNRDKVDEVWLGLLFLTLGEDNRAWKGIAWEVSHRLYEKGWIESPYNKNQSLQLTDEGRTACIASFQQHFSNDTSSSSGSALAKIRVKMDELIQVCQRLEDDSTKYFLDTLSGKIVSVLSHESENLSSDPRYLLVPVDTERLFVDAVRRYMRSTRKSKLKAEIRRVFYEDESDGADLSRALQQLLADDRRWQSWQYRRAHKRIQEWLKTYQIIDVT